MTGIAVFQITIYFVAVLICVVPLGTYIAQVYEGKSQFFSRIEKFLYHLCGIQPTEEMNWKQYLSAMLIFNLLGLLFVYTIQRLQLFLPFNPQHMNSVSPTLAFNTAASFVTNTNWQAYSGESVLSYFTQMTALTVQNFLSAATGMALLIAFIRGLIRYETSALGNFWVDTIRGVLYILLPLSFIFAVFLTSQGVIQNFKPYEKIHLMQTLNYQKIAIDQQGNPKINLQQVTEQVIPMGPVASQIAIKQLGSNGGGFFNTNGAHPFENPNLLTNFFEMLAILLIPAALSYTYGIMIKDKRQGWALLIAMSIIFIPLTLGTVAAEQSGNPEFTQFNIDQTPIPSKFSGGNMEGKETRFGITYSAIWTTATTATSNGSVNSMLDSYTPLGGLIPLWLMHLGEVIFGGVGSGLYSMLLFVIITVFITGLMVGRSPAYLGKKIDPFEMKMASIAVLTMPILVLVFSALAVVSHLGTDAISNSGPHGFTEILYAFTSMANNNGSAFAGLNTNTPFYNILGGFIILISRYWIAIPTLAIAGSLVRKKISPSSSGTLSTHSPLFIIMLVADIILMGTLTFLPALALGPIVEHLLLWGQHGH